VLLCNSTKIEFRCEGGGAIWHSRRISWDGFRDLILLDGELKGAAWMFDDIWHPFTVSLASGVVEGGSYCEAQQEEK